MFTAFFSSHEYSKFQDRPPKQLEALVFVYVQGSQWHFWKNQVVVDKQVCSIE